MPTTGFTASQSGDQAALKRETHGRKRVRRHTGQVDAFIFIDISVRLAEIRVTSANGWRLVINALRQVSGKIDPPAFPPIRSPENPVATP